MFAKYCLCVMLMMALCTAGCTHTTRPDNSRGRPTHYEDPSSPGALSGVGIESQDVVSITDQMMRDILAAPGIASRTAAPVIVMDSEFFHNESTTIINKNLFTDRLRTELNRAANGRIVFVARHQAGMVEEERILEQEGVVTGGTRGQTDDALGYDYRLGGRIASLDTVARGSGVVSRYHQVTFELVERGSGRIVWDKTYEFRKVAQDDIVYR